MGQQEVEQFLTYLAVELNVAASTQNQALNAIIFLYKQVLKIELGKMENITRAKVPQNLPTVFSQEEMMRILPCLEGMSGLANKLIYGSGMRAMECLRLRVKDIDFDRKQIKRVMINLLENGIAVLPDGGEISINVSTDDENKNILIRVADNGPGVKDDDKLRLFEPYFSTKKSGTGLGLAIANAIIADHGGSIRVEDNIPKGTVFIIELPLIS